MWVPEGTQDNPPPETNGCLNFTTTQGKVNLPRVTRGRVVSGTRDHINGALG